MKTTNNKFQIFKFIFKFIIHFYFYLFNFLK